MYGSAFWKTLMRRLSIVLAVFAVVTELGTSRVQATVLEFSFTDPQGDAFLFPGEVGPITDVAGLFFTFDNTTADYSVTMTAFSSDPFIGDVVINVNLFNANAGTNFFSSNVFDLNTSLTSITLTGTDFQLFAWQAGDQVAACEGSGGVLPEACTGGLGSPINFSAGVVNFDPDAPPAEFNIARDAFQTSPPATISVVPIPAAFWLFATALLWLVGIRYRQTLRLPPQASSCVLPR